MDSRFTRRQVLGGSARLGLALAAGVPLLQACGDSGGGSSGGKQTKSIADGLEPETGPLRIFNYDSYVNPDVVADFEEKYGVKVEITTFTTDDEAITKLALRRSRGRPAPLRTSTTTLFKLIDGGLIQPLNKTYLHQLRQCRRLAQRPVVRPGRRVLGAVHRVRHRHRLPRRPDRPRRPCSVGHVVEPASTRA